MKLLIIALFLICTSFSNTEDPNVTLSKIDVFLYKYYDKSTDVTCYVNYKVKDMECFHKLKTDSVTTQTKKEEWERQYDY